MRQSETSPSDVIMLNERLDLQMGEVVLRNCSAIEASRRHRWHRETRMVDGAEDELSEDTELIDWTKIRSTIDYA